ncbi:hypothetical protein GCM10009846_26980 [Agrococcus versicolor]|uniref:DUF2993 domain-containing protein n=1 Tax=Agrococcus versicolor TaxID=501482 RepID=A0ABN3AXD1_9MICO
MSEHLELGPAPRPTTGDDLVARIRTAVLRDATDALRPGVERLLDGLVATVEGADVVSLDLDGTGVRLDGLLADDAGVGDLLPTSAADVIASEPGVLRLLTVRAHPIHVEGVPVELGLTLEDLRIRWVEVAGGTVGLDVVEPDEAHPVRGHLRVEAPQAELVEVVRGIAERTAAEQGVELRELDVRLTSDGPRTVRAEMDARVKKGFLGAPASASATLRVDDALRVHVEDLRVTSSNVLVAGLLGAVRGRIEDRVREPIDLAAQLPAGVRLTDVRVEAGERIGVEARLG